jgi:hypothetical protein
MAKLEDVANELARKFIFSTDKKYTLNRIIYDMNYLVYSDSKEPLTYYAKSAIFRHIFNIIAGREKLCPKDGESVEPQFSDIVIFFERRSALLKLLRTGVKKQSQLN